MSESARLPRFARRLAAWRGHLGVRSIARRGWHWAGRTGLALLLVLVAVVPAEPAHDFVTLSATLLVRLAEDAAPLPHYPLGRWAPALAEPAVGVLRVQRVRVSTAALARVRPLLEALPGVRGVEPLTRVQAAGIPNDPYFSDFQWNLRQVRAPEAWDLTTGDRRITIAVLDTGIALDHPDLQDKILPGQNFVQPGASPNDDNGHGTHIAGVAAAATNNALGVAGMAWDARLPPVKVLDAAGGGDIDRVAQGIVWAADQGARIINLSFSGSSPSAVLGDAIQYARGKGALVVAAVGNEGRPDPTYPAAMDGVLAVTATDRNDERLGTANWGSYVSVAAPGQQIASTFWDPTAGNTYAASSTSSQAAPHVSGLAALLWAVNPGLTPEAVRTLIEAHADDRGAPGRDDQFGHGRINAYRSVLAALPWHHESSGALAYRAPVEPASRLLLPYVQKARDGWTSTLLFHNPTAQPAVLAISFHNLAGGQIASVGAGVNAYGVASLPLQLVGDLPAGFQGTATVDVMGRLTALVQQDRPGVERHGYTGVPVGATRLFAPMVQREGRGGASTLYLQNALETRETATVSFYASTGSLVAQESVALAPRGAGALRLAEVASLPERFVGSAVVESTGAPLAAVASQVGLTDSSAYTLISDTGASLAAPLVFKGAGGWASTLHVVNAGGAPAQVTVTYTRTGNPAPVSETSLLGPRGVWTVPLAGVSSVPDDYVGSVTISAAGGALAAVVQHTRAASSLSMVYAAALGGATNLSVPFLARDYGGWTAGLRLQNLAPEATEVSITYYDQAGRVVLLAQESLPAAGGATFSLGSINGLPWGFLGSATVVANGRPVVASVNWVKRRP